jgi:hypothetical protein
MDPEKMATAERWLLGSIMDNDELFYLGVESDLKTNFMAEELLRLLLTYFDDNIILMFDDLDKSWVRYNPYYMDQEELDWTDCTDESKESDSVSEKKTEKKTFFSQLHHLLLLKNIKIVFTMQKENEDEFFLNFMNMGNTDLAYPLEIPSFTKEDTKEFFLEAMKGYFVKNNLNPVIENAFFPLSEIILNKVHQITGGNPRKIIRSFQRLFDAIIFDNYSINQLEEKCQDII